MYDKLRVQFPPLRLCHRGRLMKSLLFIRRVGGRCVCCAYSKLQNFQKLQNLTKKKRVSIFRATEPELSSPCQRCSVDEC